MRITLLGLVFLLLLPLTLFAAPAEVPRTGQTTCYDVVGSVIACNGTGQDGAQQAGAAWPDPRFTDNGDDTVSDNLTGLIWAKDAYTPATGPCTSGSKSWQGALDYVACLNTANYLGFNDWILPNILELKSLVDAAESNPVLPADHPFFSVQDYYWSSSTDASDTGSAWEFWSNDGTVVAYDKTDSEFDYVWPVRGGQSSSTIALAKTGQTTSYAAGDDGDLQRGVAAPASRFTDNGDGTVKDHLTGLIWLSDANCTETVAGVTKGSGTLNWLDALSWSNNLAAGNCDLTDSSAAGDWRLPNVRELASLTDYSLFNSALSFGHPFTGVQSSGYWSSSTNSNNTVNTWNVNLGNGVVNDGSKASSLYAWPVRGGQSTLTFDVTPSAGANGSMAPAIHAVPQGQTTSFTITPAVDYFTDSVSGCGGSLVGNIYTTGAITGACTVTASFSKDTDGDGTLDSTDTDDDNDGVSDVDELALGIDPLVANAFTPRTGQTTCYDAVGSVIACADTGQDGAFQVGGAWPDPRFTDNADSTITDNLTGLTWVKDASTPEVGACTSGTKSWQGALDYVACLNTENYLGYTDWSLPNILELKSLVDAGEANPALPADHYFESVQSGYYWSSSTSAAGTGRAWGVGVDEGVVDYGYKTSGYYVWPVRAMQSNSTIDLAKTGQTTTYATGDDGDLQRGIASPALRFTNNGDGTVTDNLTGLTWLAAANCTGTVAGVVKDVGILTWPDALSWSKNLAAGSCGLSDGSVAGDWRLPNARELASLVDYAKNGPSLSAGQPFTGVQLGDYWSSSTYTGHTGGAWFVNMDFGFVLGGYKTNGYYTWPVRGGQPTLTFDVTPSVGANGSMTPATIQTVAEGQPTRFTITPDPGYKLQSVSGCGGSLVGRLYSTAAITVDCEVTAIFVDNDGVSDVDELVLGTDPSVANAFTPRTGQTICYDVAGSVIDCTGTGQDGALRVGGAWAEPRFTDNLDNTIIDNLTGLIWAKDASTPAAASCTAGTKSWQGALDYVACLNSENYLGYNDWILPNILELKSLFDGGESNPALPADYPFLGVQEYYWSSSTDASDTGFAWELWSNDGIVSTYDKTDGGFDYVWPVREAQSNSTIVIAKTGQTTSYATGDDGDLQRGVASPALRFTHNGDGTVTDHLTGLTWLADANCTETVAGVVKDTGALTWPEALSWSNNLAAGHCGLNDSSVAGDWRLPNARELASLADYAMFNPALPVGQPFAGVQLSGYWSSSTIAGITDAAWFVDMNNGFVNGHDKIENHHVWTVRGGQLASTFLVTPSAGANGSMNPAARTVFEGLTTSFTITPDLGYTIGTVSGCGGGLVGSTYTTAAITAACEVTATFVDDDGVSDADELALGTDPLVANAFIPRTGQATCYDAAGGVIACSGTGQDGALRVGGAWPDPRFTDNLDNTITDNLTGLIWAQDASTSATGSCIAGSKSWQEALDYVACLNTESYLGYKDWILPNILELKSLVDAGVDNPALPIDHPFTGLQVNYWSSSTDASAIGSAWAVHNSGATFSADKSGGVFVWPVREGRSSSTIVLAKTGQTTSYATSDDGDLQRGVTSPVVRFTNNGDGTVTDNLTGLTWLEDANCTDTVAGVVKSTGTLTWSDALSWSNNLAAGRCSLSDGSVAGDWRLANARELASLADYSKYSPALPAGQPFTGVQLGGYWSSSTYVGVAAAAWSVDMNNGFVDASNKPNNGSVWPVRGGLSTLTFDVTPTAGSNGSMTPATIQTVALGQTTSFTITPATGFKIDSVSGCGGSLVGSTYTTAVITVDCEVTASFAVDTDADNDGVSDVDELALGTDPLVANAFIPRTGQATCYDATGSAIACTGTGQDGALQVGSEWPDSRFTDNADSTITDNLTGLVWVKDASTRVVGACTSGTKSWQGALDYVACLNTENYLGYNDWILPNILELRSLADAGEADLALPADHPFASVHSDAYWSSSTDASDTGLAWVAYMNDGSVLSDDKTSVAYVWPVREELSNSTILLAKTGQTTSYATGDDGDLQRGVASPISRFTNNGDGTVTDSLTGLTWLADANCAETVAGVVKGSGTLTWPDALTWSRNLAAGSCGLNDSSVAGDWRLPNARELASLADYSMFNPALPVDQPFTAVQLGEYWSSSSYTGNAGGAWYVRTYDGYVGATSKALNNSVWPVRGGQPTLTFDVIPSAGADGSMTPAIHAVADGQTTRFTITPDVGYKVDSVSGCGGSLVGSIYTTGAITVACEVAASFVVDSDPDSDGDGTPDSSDADDDNDGVSDVDEAALGTDPLVKNAFTPRTGQAICYDTSGSVIACTGTGQDGVLRVGSAWPDPRFTDNADNTITDNLTGLIWAKEVSTPAVGACTSGTKSWQGALDYVACLNTENYLGYNDWILPNILELKSLVNAEEANPALPAGHPFASVQSDAYWSSSTDASVIGSAWLADMNDGSVLIADKTSVAYAWPVREEQSNSTIALAKTGQTMSYATGDDGDLQRGVASPASRFTDNGDGTVTDHLTGLIWLADANCNETVAGVVNGYGSLTWPDALSWSNSLAAGNCGLSDNSMTGDWRLPNARELTSLADYSKYSPALPVGQPFTGVQSSGYWSSTTYADSPGIAWSVQIADGGVLASYKTADGYVWPVRGGQPILTLEVSLDGSGTVSPDSRAFDWTVNTGTADYPLGRIVTLTATPDVGNSFTGWGGACSGTGNCTVTMDSAQSVTASFTLNSYTLSYTAGANGMLTGTSPQTVDHGASGTAVEAVPNANHSFLQWSDGSTENPRVDSNVSGGIAVVAQFADAIPPGAPASVAINEVSDGSIQLTWTNPADADFDHCVIYRSLSPGALGNIVSDSTTGQSYLDGPGLVGGLTYYYTLRAVDAAGNESTKTNQVSLTLSDYEGSGLSCSMITSLPYVITTQGLYCLEAALTTSITWGAAIEVQTNNVTIDFKGNTIDNLSAGTTTNTYGVYALSRKNIVLKNATIRGFRSGVYLDGGSGHQVLDNNLDANTQYGIYMTGQGKVEGNLIINTGGRPGSDAAPIYLNTGASLVRNNIISVFDAPTGYAANGIHLAQSGQNLVQNNTISGPIGGSATTSGVYVNNDAPGSDIISANMITGVDHGIRLENNANVVLRKNSFANCTNDYTIGAGSSTDDAGDNYPTIP